jgi:type I restriction enzyme S subunit
MTFEKVKWGEVLSIKNGRNQKAVENPYGQYPIYGSGGVMGYADDYLCEAGTTIIGRKGSINNPIFVKEKFWNVDTAFGLQAGKSLDEKYLYYFCKTYNFLKHNKATTLPSLTKADLLNIKIPLPPLATQKKIAAILDAADAHRQKTNQLLAKYDELAQSIFLEMFGDPVTNPKGWEVKKMGEICGVGSSKRVFVSELLEEGIPFYRGTEVGALATGESVSPELFISSEHFEELKSHTGVPKSGDLLMPSICPDGRIWKVDNDLPFYFKDGRVLWVRVNLDVFSSSYILFLLKELFRTSYHEIASGTTFAELKIIALKGLKVLVPELRLQQEFETKINSVEKQKILLKKEIVNSENLFNSLLQKAFKGELVK